MIEAERKRKREWAAGRSCTASNNKKSARAQSDERATGSKRSDSGASILRPTPLAMGVISVAPPTAAAEHPF